MAVDVETIRQFALALSDTDEHDHFGRPAFRVNQRIFATVWPAENRLMVILTPIDQSVFHSFDPAIFFPVPNKWGLKGCTFIQLETVRQDMVQDALTIAYELAASKTKKKKR